MASNIERGYPGKQIEEYVYSEWGIDKGKMLGIPYDGLHVEWGASGGMIRVELVGVITPEQGARMRQLLATGNAD